MLRLELKAYENYNETTNTFTTTKPQTICLEHSLVSISKWESKWNTPFLSKSHKTTEQALDYIKCMAVGQVIDDSTLNRLTKEHMLQINDYIEAEMTATKIRNENNKSASREIITSEVIYYWMIAHNIPFECEKWHLNRLLTLINVCNVKNSPPKKMSKSEIARRNAELNAARKKALNSGG